MEDNFVSLQVHKEFAKRMEEANRRQDKRIELLEEEFRKLNALTVAVEKMAVNMENMIAEQKKQGERLEALEKEPAETHKQIKMSVITTTVGAIAGAVIGAVLMLL